MGHFLSRFLCLTCLVLCSGLAFGAPPPPVNDDQCFPALITFTNPDPCPTWDVDSLIVLGNNIGATIDTLQPALMNCQIGGDMPNGMPDVWYIFTAPAERVSIVLSGLGTNILGLYRKESGCMDMTPVCCGIKPGSPLTLYNDVMIPGETYMLQVAGGSMADQAAFTLKFYWLHPCDDCMQTCKLMAFPPPVNGYYNPGDTVVFAYVVNGYKAYGQDYFHGISPNFGAGWDMSSLQTTVISPPSPASGNGSWNWYTNVLDESNNPVDGFFYDGPPLINGNPADNKGDAGDQYSQWIFYWRIRTSPTCTAPVDLNVEVFNYSDFQTGSGANPACKYDADATFKAVLICCPSPNISITDESCPGNSDGNVAVQINGSPGPWDCYVYNSNSNLVFSTVNTPVNTFVIPNLPADDYVMLTQASSSPTCYGVKSFVISNSLDLTIFQTNATCVPSCGNSAMILGQTNGNYNYLWTPSNQTGAAASNLCPGIYNVLVTETTLGCSDSLTINVQGLPADDAFFQYLSPNGFAYCNVDTASPRPSYIAVPGGTFSWNGPPGNLNTQTGIINLIPTITAGTYTITYTTPGPCTNSSVHQITINQSPPFPLVNPVSSVCYDQQPITLLALNGGTNMVIWADTLNFFNTLFTGNPYVLPTLPPGAYTYFVIYNNPANGCYGYPNQINFNIFPLPLANAGLDTTICLGHSVILNGSGVTNNNYLWSPATGLNFTDIPNPNASPDTTTTYSVIVTSPDGCTATDFVTVNVVNDANCDMVVYNGFSPNGDGKNDGWFIEGIDTYKNNLVHIYNRWGDLVWSAENYNNRDVIWQGSNNAGKELPAGTYFFVINADDLVRRGWVEITR